MEGGGVRQAGTVGDRDRHGVRALLAEGSTPDDFDVAMLLDSPAAKLLRKVFAQINSLDRAYFRALGDLRRIQRESDAVLSPLDTMILEAACAPDAPAKISELGSFPQNRPSRPPAAVGASVAAARPSPVPRPRSTRGAAPAPTARGRDVRGTAVVPAGRGRG